MPQDFSEGQLTFRFPDDSKICRPDDSSYYVRRFQNFCSGCKEVDFIAYEPAAKRLWLLEVKDYRANPRTKQTDLADEISSKVRDSLALMRTAPLHDYERIDAWQVFLRATQLRVILHCEFPKHPSRLFDPKIDQANFQQKLKSKLRGVDPHALLVSGDSPKVPWALV